MRTVFYSWQSDLPNSTNRGFIEACLEQAIDDLHVEASVSVYPTIDKDTKGQPGSPDIVDTIFQKIEKSHAFVADVSFINGMAVASDGIQVACKCTRLTPNPNVVIELGWAMKAVGSGRIVCVFNEAT